MYKTSTEIKVGLFVLVGLAVLIWMALRLGGFAHYQDDTYPLSAVFDQATGLKVGVVVEVAGISVGRVVDIDLYEEERARVVMAIRNDVRLPVDSRAIIKAQGILGDKFVELTPGTKGQETLEAGDSIEKTVSPDDLGVLLEKLGSVADDLKVLTSALAEDGGGADLREIVTNVRDMSRQLNDLTKENGPGLTKTLTSLGRVSDNLENITDRINKGQGTLGQLINDDAAMVELKSALNGIREITTKINEGQGTLGRLVNDESTIDKIDEVLTGVNKYLEKGDAMKVSVSYRADYMTRYNFLKSTVGLRLQSTPDRYYLLGVTGDYFGNYSRTDYSTNGQAWREDSWDKGKLKFNAQIAQRFYDAVLRGGVFENGAGFGVDYYLFDDDLELTLEVFSGDFDNNPHMRAMAGYRFWKIFYAGLGYDDFISDQGRSSPFLSMGFAFTDDDLKYIISGASSFLSK